MFKKIIKIRPRIKRFGLQITPGERIRDELIKAGIKVAEESGWAAGNTTEKLVQVADKVGSTVDFGAQLTGGSEAARALGRIAYKSKTDIMRGDKLCTGLCLVSATCETICIGCAVIKILPFRENVYLTAKLVSQGCMTFRNLCAGEGC